MLNVCFEQCHLTGKYVGTCTEMDPLLTWHWQLWYQKWISFVVRWCSYIPVTKPVLQSIHCARSVVSRSGAALRRHPGTLLNKDMEPKGGFLWQNSHEKMAKIEFLMKRAPRPSASATHRKTGWGLHQRGWSNDACTTPQRRPRHELSWIWTDFLSEQRRATDFVEKAGRVGDKRQPARCSRKTEDKFAIASVANKCYAPLHRRACTSACAFFAESMHEFRQVLWALCMCRCVR